MVQRSFKIADIHKALIIYCYELGIFNHFVNLYVILTELSIIPTYSNMTYTYISIYVYVSFNWYFNL